VNPSLRERRASPLARHRDIRARWLAKLTRVIDGGLRSPLFLVCMRYGLAATIEAQSLHASAFGRRPSRRRAPQR
jgi:hypothetical protein